MGSSLLMPLSIFWPEQSIFDITGIIFMITAVAFFLLKYLKRPTQLPFPVVRVDESLGDKDVFSALRRGSKLVSWSNLCMNPRLTPLEYPTTPFTLVDPPITVVILPVSSISELKDVPTSKASFRKFLYEYWQGRYSYIGQYSHALEGAIKTGISHNVDFQLSTLTEETKFAVEQNIGACNDWSEISLSAVFHKIVALTTFRTFVGLPLSRDEIWIEATTQYASTLEKFASAVRGWPVSVQWLVAPIYWFTSVRKHQQVFINMLDPIVRAAKQARRDHLDGVSGKSPGTLIEWMLSYYRGREATASEITGAQLTASFAAIHSTVGLLEHVLLDLASRPDCLQSLRDELAEHCPSGQIDKVALGKLWKMDSFIKESQRYNPATAFHMLRLSSTSVSLGGWPTLPPGTNFAVSAAATNHSDKLENSESFDGFRFARMRAEPGSENRHQLISTGPDATSFGHGPHACPGRFFASNEIKVILAYLMQTYDIKLKDGQDRPKNLFLPGGAVFPDPSATIWVKERKNL